MRNGVVLVALLAWVVATSGQSAKQAKSELLLRWDFAGTKQLAASSELKTLKEVLALPETDGLRETAASNFAARAAARLAKGNTNSELPKLIQPLFSDLIQSESRFEMLSKAQDADWVLAVKLSKERSPEWGNTLTQLAKQTGMQVTSSGTGENDGWTAKKENYRLSFSRVKDWTIIEGGSGEPDSKAAREFRSSLGKRKGKQVLNAEVNTPLLGGIWNVPAMAHYPKMTLSMEPKGEGLRSELLIDYPENLGITPEKWNVPTTVIQDPLIGFTAVQGVAKKLAAWGQFKSLGAEKTPNQLFLWAEKSTPFSIMAAAEVKNPAQVVTNAGRVIRESKLPIGPLVHPTNRVALLWRGLPFAVPFIEVGPAPYSSFLTAGLFPVTPGKPKPAPAELFDQLNQKNLIYYDWEITGDRLAQWIPIRQLFYLAFNQYGPNGSAASSKWLMELRNKLGNTITAGTLEGPQRVKLERQSPIGFSALELVLLAHAIDQNDLISLQNRGSKQPQNNIPAPGLP